MPDLTGLPDQPADFDLKRYRGLAAEGWSIYEVDPRRSLVKIHVYRAGRMERLGHNHVVSTRAVRGLAAISGRELRSDLYIPVSELIVDDAELRAAAGEDFQSDLSDQDKQDTRANMLSEKVLDVRAHPFLKAGVTFTEFGEGRNELLVGVRIKGQRQGIRIPMDITADEGLKASGKFSLLQSDFGIEPFSILGGAVAVADRVDVEFELVFLPPPER